MKKILVLNGPNLNMTGIRSKDVYGAETLDSINAELAAYAREKGAEVEFFQSNSEGAIIDKIHHSLREYDGVVLKSGAYTHYSYAIRDALECVKDFTPFVEVHMSDIHAREDFRKSRSSPRCVWRRSAGWARTVIKKVLIYYCKYYKILVAKI